MAEFGNHAEIVSKVQQKGDTLDPRKKVTGRISPKQLAVIGALTSPLFIESINYKPGLNYLLGHAAFSAMAGVVFGATYAYGRIKEKRSQAAAEGLQEEFRKLVGEPVDLITTREKKWGGLRRKKGPVDLRWYGMDNLTLSSGNALEIRSRLSAMVEVAEMSGIETIVVGASPVVEMMKRDGELSAEEMRDPVATPYGELLSSERYLTEAKEISKAVHDPHTDPKVFVATIDEAKALVKKIADEGSWMQNLTEIIGDPKIQEAYARWKHTRHSQRNINTDIQFQNFLGEKIARHFAIENPSSLLGTRGNREKYHNTYQVAAGNLYEMSTSSNSSDTIASPGRNLLTIFGYRAYELSDFITAVLNDNHTNPADRKVQALVALYESVRQDALDNAKIRVVREGEKVETMYQRIAREPKVKMRKVGKGGDNHEVEYTHSKEFWRRAMAAGIATALMGGGAYGAGEATVKFLNYQYTQGVEASGGDIDYANDETFEEYSKRVQQAIDSGNPILAHLYNTLNGMSAGGYLLNNSIAHEAVSLGVPQDIVTEISGVHYYDWEILNSQEEKNEQLPLSEKQPTSVESKDQAFTGDAHFDSNYEIYHVEELGDQSMQGLWYTDIYNTIGLSSGTPSYPYSDVGIVYTGNYEDELTQIDVLSDPAQSQDKLLFAVTTPYLSENVVLSRPNATRVAVVRLIDQNNPEHTAAVEVFRDAKGMYRAKIPPELVNTFTSPALEYYLASSTDPEDIIHAYGNMALLNEDGTRKEISEESSNQVKKALGLPATATDFEVQAAEQSKDYSFTPIEDSGLYADKVKGDKTVEEVVTDMVESQAKLAEANCNVANTVTMFAEAGMGNIAVGFRVGENGSLSEQGAHLWRIKDGTVSDATPFAFGGTGVIGTLPVQKPQIKKPEVKKTEKQEKEEDLEKGLGSMKTTGELLLAGAAGAMLYRKRKKIQRVIEQTINNFVKKSYFDDDSPRAKSVQGALSVINQVLYANPEMPFMEGKSQPSLSYRMSSLPKELSDKQWDAIQEYALTHEIGSDVVEVLDQLRSDWSRIRKAAMTK